MGKKEGSKNANGSKLQMIVLGSICLIMLLLIVAYFCISQFYKEHFYAKTFINGLDCSNLTVEEARERMTQGVDTYVLNVKERNGKTERIQGKDIDLACKFDVEIDKVLEEQASYSWLAYAGKDNKVDNPYEYTFNKEKLEKVINNMECLQKKNQVEPTNAKISSYSKDKGFTIIAEKQGCKVNKKKLTKVIQTSIKNFEMEVAIDKAGCYEKPAITSTNAKLKKTMDTINKYMGTKIKVKFGTKTDVLDKAIIGPAINVSKSGKVTINEDKIKEYVTYLARTYNNVPNSRRFRTSYGSTVTVSGGDLGWELDKDKELDVLLQCIKKGEKKTKEAISTMDNVKCGSDEIGKTYVEINLTKQHLFYYIRGKLFFQTDIVSGNPTIAGRETPTGCYCVRWMQRNRTLRGPGYATKVAYWMPFIDEIGVGMHDASWQHGIFGGKRYLTNGSHGCINLSPADAAKIFNNIEPGVPVIVYK